jgi:hypothetical protein
MDIATGSGRRGQTYLYWHGDALFELPVSYWTALDSWVNSPGYADGFADFSRSIPPRCLECHATYFEALEPDSNRYDRTTFVLGITCEKCHGAGRQHAARRSVKDAAGNALPDSIINPRKLSRDRQTDLCALCHG